MPEFFFAYLVFLSPVYFSFPDSFFPRGKNALIWAYLRPRLRAPKRAGVRYPQAGREAASERIRSHPAQMLEAVPESKSVEADFEVEE